MNNYLIYKKVLEKNQYSGSGNKINNINDKNLISFLKIDMIKQIIDILKNKSHNINTISKLIIPTIKKEALKMGVRDKMLSERVETQKMGEFNIKFIYFNKKLEELNKEPDYDTSMLSTDNIYKDMDSTLYYWLVFNILFTKRDKKTYLYNIYFLIFLYNTNYYLLLVSDIMVDYPEVQNVEFYTLINQFIIPSENLDNLLNENKVLFKTYTNSSALITNIVNDIFTLLKKKTSEYIYIEHYIDMREFTL